MTASQPSVGTPGGHRPVGQPTPAGPQTTPGPARAPAPAAPTSRRGRTVGWSLVAASLVFVTVVLVLFVLFNTQTVDISLVFGNVEAPLVLALVIAAVLGGLMVGLTEVALRRRRSRRS